MFLSRVITLERLLSAMLCFRQSLKYFRWWLPVCLSPLLRQKKCNLISHSLSLRCKSGSCSLKFLRFPHHFNVNRNPLGFSGGSYTSMISWFFLKSGMETLGPARFFLIVANGISSEFKNFLAQNLSKMFRLGVTFKVILVSVKFGT